LHLQRFNFKIIRNQSMLHTDGVFGNHLEALGDFPKCFESKSELKWTSRGSQQEF
jgi:hypothetical protein